jgi:hypothetical protein
MTDEELKDLCGILSRGLAYFAHDPMVLVDREHVQQLLDAIERLTRECDEARAHVHELQSLGLTQAMTIEHVRKERDEARARLYHADELIDALVAHEGAGEFSVRLLCQIEAYRDTALAPPKEDGDE